MIRRDAYLNSKVLLKVLDFSGLATMIILSQSLFVTFARINYIIYYYDVIAQFAHLP